MNQHSCPYCGKPVLNGFPHNYCAEEMAQFMEDVTASATESNYATARDLAAREHTVGTPRTLREGVLRIFATASALTDLDTKVIKCTQDFLAQRFSAALLKAQTPAEEQLIDGLWKSIQWGDK